MCLELIFMNSPKTLPVLVAMLVVVRSQLYDSPCPRTFQYQMDQNGELHGKIGVYPFDENKVELLVQLSVGNEVQNFNGRIELGTPRNQVVDNIRNRMPIEYRVYFPRWQNIPPKVTKITVNGQDVCLGPPLTFNRFTGVVTTVTLNHRFVKVQPLSSNPFNPGNNVIGSGNPFLGNGPNGGKNWENSFPGGGGADGGKRFNNQNPFLGDNSGFNGGRDYDDEVFIMRFTTSRPTTVKATTAKVTTTSVAANDLLFSSNPFLNGRGSPRPPIVTTPPPPKQTTRPPVSKPQPPSSNNQCGIPVVANLLVVNGKSVPRGAFPWLTAMFVSTGTGVEYKCAGSLVSTRHVITAAHCVQKSRRRIPADKFLFILGKLNIETLLIGNGEKMVGADDIKVHPDYVPLESDADIAVVILSQVIEFSNYIRPICLWAGSDDIDTVVGEKGKVVGWGRDENNNSMTAEPRQTTMPIVSQEECLRSGEVFKYITSQRTFCAGYRNESGPCNGDSGSGFIMKSNEKWFLKGIVSTSKYDSVKQSCDLTNYVVFTDISKFRTWLLSIIVI
ncbi:proclotting enzyme-like isoform X2 [Zophobas morio]|uniref:proclotting enzyme-like isoform X2 n=1 Tax=Zophobas morio TaxID=2755281 RepID=UPI003083C688